jgi:hypothetical protein
MPWMYRRLLERTSLSASSAETAIGMSYSVCPEEQKVLRRIHRGYGWTTTVRSTILPPRSARTRASPG